VTYEEWKDARLERVAGRCGGNPTFKGTRLQPHDVIATDENDPEDLENAAQWGLVREDLVHARRFAADEPHWKILSQGRDQHGRRVSDEEYDALRLQYRVGWED